MIEYISAVSKFFDYLKRKGIVFENPFKSIKKVKLNKKDHKEHTERERYGFFIKCLKKLE